MKKRIIALMLLMCISLAACGSEEDVVDNETETVSEETEALTESEIPEGEVPEDVES